MRNTVLKDSEGCGLWTVCWYIRLKCYLELFLLPQLSAPPSPCPASPRAQNWVLTSFQPVLWGQPSLHLSGVLFSKGRQRIQASIETSGGGKYLGKTFFKLGTHRKKHPGSDFLCSRILSWNPTAPRLRTGPAAWSIMEVLFKIV